MSAERVGATLGTKKLYPCVKCKMPSKYLMTMRYFEDGQGQPLTKFFIKCDCKKHLMFNSEKEAITAWNKANPISR
jgi:hypothetical protein